MNSYKKSIVSNFLNITKRERKNIICCCIHAHSHTHSSSDNLYIMRPQYTIRHNTMHFISLDSTKSDPQNILDKKL